MAGVYEKEQKRKLKKKGFFFLLFGILHVS